jgi:GH43 family beta-xylosidase
MSNIPIADIDTPDPWMIRHNNTFYLTFTLGNRVEIWKSDSMENFRSPQKITAWQPSPGTPWSIDLWAPELHYLHGTWYIYFCAAHPGRGNPSHRTVLLRSSSQDPMDSLAWSFLGPLHGLPDHWNIDATVLSLRNKLYCCYSGWPLGDSSDTQQDLFLIELADPEHALTHTLTCISRAELPWERPDGGRRGVNEGPTWLSMSVCGGEFEGIVYSANGSWTSDYTLGLLHYTGNGDDPLNPKSWRKRPTPLLKSCRDKGGPFGPGHASFIPVVDEGPRNFEGRNEGRPLPAAGSSGWRSGRVYCIYHATEKEGEGWNNRKARVLCLHGGHFHPSAESCCCCSSTSSRGGGMAGPQQRLRKGHEEPAKHRSADHQGPGGLLHEIGNMIRKKINEF